MQVLTVNGGSSSIKWALYDASDDPCRSLGGRITGIGSAHTQFTVLNNSGMVIDRATVTATSSAAAYELIDWLREAISLEDILGVGYRIVHGGQRYMDTTCVSAELIEEPVAPMGSGTSKMRSSTSRPIFASCQVAPTTLPSASVARDRKRWS